MATLAEIRARLQAQENKSQGKFDREGGDNAMFAHWNMEEGTTSSLRFVPDGDDSNPYFWVEKAMIKLPFNGVKGGDSKQVIVQVPCMEMWNETCPILTEVRPWFKDPSLEDMGRKYWKKRTYLFQGFVRENALVDDKAPENPIRRFILSPQLFPIVKAALLDPELENLPTDYVHGLDFRITKTSKVGFADYSTSNWARRETALTAAEQAAIEQYGLPSLKDFLPKKPSSIELQVMKDMFEASVNGEAYDPDRWATYFRPGGMPAPVGQSGQKPAQAAPRAPAPVAPAPRAIDAVPVVPAPTTKPWEDDVATAESAVVPPVAAEKPANADDKAAAILAMIRSRQTKTA